MIIHPGEPGAGTRTKLARNTLTLTSYAAACKAPKFAEAARLDPQPPRPEVQVRHTDARTGSPRAITAPNDIKHLEPNNFPYQPLHHTRGPGQKHLSPAAALAQPLTVDPPLTHPHGQTAPPRPEKMNKAYRMGHPAQLKAKKTCPRCRVNPTQQEIHPPRPNRNRRIHHPLSRVAIGVKVERRHQTGRHQT